MKDISSHFAHTAGPTHIAVLADSLVVQAELHALSGRERYRAGVEHISTLVMACLDLGVPIVTLGLAASEAHIWSAEDRMALMQSVVEMLDATAVELQALGVAVRLMGDWSVTDVLTAGRYQHGTAIACNTPRLMLNLVFTYDSRADIAQAIQRMRADGIRPDQVTEQLLSSYLLTHSVPDPDLIIQTGGTLRLGNFLLWQAAYAEYYAAPVSWLDFDRAALQTAITAYAGRERRFGALPAA